ncbi:hypothetical protein PVK06_047145 [Gossypium arboreum]|uniref:Reverse transcriptase n=1 Tax=Gossypium arboreum TaxID=29729 RepID=A0ABR0MCX5_GOSAR|nr:hypothetical protein PVK06_047145 [Gossypium arboreum]
MGFDSDWFDSIMKCVTTVSCSVVFNGYTGQHFFPSRRLRQGDPFNPFFFLFCGERLFSLMWSTMKEKVTRVKVDCRFHVCYLRTIVFCSVFGEATKRGVVSLKQLLHEYENCSSQSANYTKSTIFFNSYTQEGDKRILTRVLGVHSSNNLERYLDLPNLVGRKKKASFQSLNDRLQQQIDNWSIKHLSQGGKEVFIKAILQSIPT